MKAAGVLTGCMALVSAVMPMPSRDRHPQIVSHRGACGYVPEHNLNAYQLAIDLGTDYIEPDFISSSDGVLIAMHDLTLDATTDIASHPEFSDRKSTKVVAGSEMSGFFAIDFTYEELSTLTVRQRRSGRTLLFDGYFKIPTVDDIINLVVTQYSGSNFTIGLFPETKDPGFHFEHGIDTGAILISKLASAGFLVQGSDVPRDIMNQVVPVAIQCFDSEELKYLSTITDIPLVYLFSAEQALVLFNEEMLAEIKTFASSVAPEKSFFTFGNYSVAQAHVDLAHSAGLAIHPWTFREDSVGTAFTGDAKSELEFYICCLGIDGFFTEFTDHSREDIDAYLTYEHGKDCSIDCSLY